MQLVRNFWQSQVGKKVVMAATGLIGAGFVVVHMLGHLQMFESAARYNAYARFLHSLGGLLWAARAVLLGAVVLHAIAAVQLSRQRLAARPIGYQHGSQWEVSTFASRYIRWGGALLLAFIVFHVLHFTALEIFPEYEQMDVYSRVVVAFGKPWLLAFYLASMVALGLHLYHGIWSALRTIGAARPSPHPLRRVLPAVLAAIIAGGFAVVPLAIAAGLIKPEAPATVVTSPRVR